MVETEDIKLKRNLTALVEFSRIINSNLDLSFILNNILLTCMGKFFATKGLIALKFKGKLKLMSYKGISEEFLKGYPEPKADHHFMDDEEFAYFLNDVNLVVVEKINSSEECIGILCLGEKLNKSPYTEDDMEFLRTILNIASSGVQNSLTVDQVKKVNRSLDTRINRLNSLFELSKEFGLFSESTRVARLLVYSVIGQFLVSKFAVVTFEGKKIDVLESKFPENELINALKNYQYNKIETSVVLEEIKNKFPKIEKLQVELIVPMQMQGQTKGLILLGKRINNKNYSESDIEFIYSVGSLAIISLENKKLFYKALEKQKLEEELEIAKGIQKNLLPRTVPKYSNFEIEVVNKTSQQVGGDYYDLIKLDDNTLCTAIGDVSGKGVPAALLMANLQAFLKTTSRQGMKIEESTALMNDLISENTSDGKFITFFWSIFENDSKKITYVNAGHNYPLLVRKNKIIKLDKGGMIFGVMKTEIPYESETIQLEKDDVLILFTDGVTEAMNKSGEEFSDERLESLALKFHANSAFEILDSIRKEVETFSYGTSQSDDITLIVIKVK